MKQQFAFSYLVLSPTAGKILYISCGCGNLWHLPSGGNEIQNLSTTGVSLGVDPNSSYTEKELTWLPGDILVYYTTLKNQPLVSQELFSAKSFQEALLEPLNDSMQKKADALIRKSKLHLSRTSSESSLVLMSILNNSFMDNN